MKREQPEKWKPKDGDVRDEGEEGERPQVGHQRKKGVNEIRRYALSMKTTKLKSKKRREAGLKRYATIEFNRLSCRLSGLSRGIKINWIISEVKQQLILQLEWENLVVCN